MRRLGLLLLLSLACSRPAPPASASASAPPVVPDPLAPVHAKALEGDMRSGLELLAAIPISRLTPEQQQQRACMIERLRAPHSGPSVVDAYRAYWTKMLLKELSPAEGEAYLLDRLRPALGARGANAASLDASLDLLGAQLEEEGLHSIRGTTKPYRDLMIWRRETPMTYDVVLPDGPAKVDVVLLRDFDVLGWSAFATCEARYTGGWATKDKLYCVADSYDLSSEKFSVSFLVHEGQHFADYKRFPKLAQPELEYRAKLAELIASRRTTRKLVDTFAANATDADRYTAPHAFANRVLVRGLGDARDDATIRRVAAELFDANTKLLVAKGRELVSEVL